MSPRLLWHEIGTATGACLGPLVANYGRQSFGVCQPRWAVDFLPVSQRGASSGILSGVTLIRAVAIGFLGGGAGALIFDPRGEGLDHLRLALLMGLLVGQLLTVPVSLLGGAVWALPRKEGAIRLYDFFLGSLLMALGVLVVTQSQAAVTWLSTEPTPGGVGDPDGEISIAGLAGLSGYLMVFVGLALLANGVWTSTRKDGLRPTAEASQD
ncbi:hypothetical protein [Streptomyces sp. F-7]|uniref:hypothetical protein n=1 Tax=Streptomyces sp. F-7 TaxID=573566 RepID=UPI000A541946|nr:hypothetical protein [Streptomyces sp. F-7]